MKKVLALAAFAALLSACSVTEGVQNGSAELAGANTESATQPYVKLVWATSQSAYIGGSPYTKYKLSATGLIEVENVAYNKQVIVHWLSNSVWVDTAATYYKANGVNEYWIFKTGGVEYMPYFGSAAIQFAIRYTVNGITKWDNNGGANYSVNGQGAGTPVAAVALGSATVKRDSAYIGSASTVSNLFNGYVTVKNLAYTKAVVAVCSTNNFTSSFNVPAAYYYGFSGNLESWKFEKYLPAVRKTVKYYFKYTVNGVTYTDNNLGSNYTASF